MVGHGGGDKVRRAGERRKEVGSPERKKMNESESGVGGGNPSILYTILHAKTTHVYIRLNLSIFIHLLMVHYFVSWSLSPRVRV